MAEDRHEQLPELGKISPRLPDPQKEEEPGPAGYPERPFLPATQPVNHNRLLKLIIDKGNRGYAVSDLHWLFGISEANKQFLQFGIDQLLRAGQIRLIMGASGRTGMVGNVYVATGRGFRTVKPDDKDEE